VVALAVFVGTAALLGWIHRADLFPPAPTTAARDDPVARCLAARSADIARMQADGVIDADRAALFRSRAAALCQAQAGEADSEDEGPSHPNPE